MHRLTTLIHGKFNVKYQYEYIESRCEMNNSNKKRGNIISYQPSVILFTLVVFNLPV